MYFIVYIIETNDKSKNSNSANEQVFAVLPQNWIKDINEHLEKFLNRSLNKNQVFTCYWTEAEGSIDENGNIKLDFEPNFRASFGNVFPSEGCYLCKLIRAKGMITLRLLSDKTIATILLHHFDDFTDNYLDAIACMMKTRRPPPIYNPNRLLENPIPKINVQAMRPNLGSGCNTLRNTLQEIRQPAAQITQKQSATKKANPLANLSMLHNATPSGMQKQSTHESYDTCKLFLDLIRAQIFF